MKPYVRSALLIAGLVGIAAAGVTIALEARTPPKVEKRAEPVLSVRTAELALQTQRPALFLIGRVEGRDYATLSAPMEAEVLEIAAREGDYFRKGVSLLKIDRRELQYTAAAQQAQLDELGAQLESVRRNRRADRQRLAEARRLLELAKNDHARNQSLYGEKVLPLRQLEQSEQALLARQSEFIAMENQVADYDTQQRRLEAQIGSAAAQLSQTQLLIERARLRAPFAGRVAKVHTSVGARPPRGAPLMDIFNPAQLRLRVAVAQRYAALVKSGDVRAIIARPAGDLVLPYVGIEPRVGEGNSSIDTFFTLAAGDWVLGAVHDVVLELPPVAEAVSAPIDAIYNDRFVYRLNAESRAEAVACERLGLTRHAQQQINVLLRCPTLQPSDKIVIDQLPSLLEGVLLKVIG